jgi:hypothetical protein
MRRLDVLNVLAEALNELLQDQHKDIDGSTLDATVNLRGKRYAVTVKEAGKPPKKLKVQI